MTSPVSSNPSVAAKRPMVERRSQLADAARQFEAIFVRQMLATARKTNFGDNLFGGQGMETFRQMQDDRFAEIAGQTGAFGLADMIEARLSQMLAPASHNGEAK